MSERPRPDLDDVREALREHDERPEDPREPEPEPLDEPAGDDDADED
jgi:hypothetical protein